MLRFARREPSAVLFAAQLAALLLYPALEDREVGRPLFSVLGIAFLALVLLPSAPRRRGRGSACCWRSPRACSC